MLFRSMLDNCGTHIEFCLEQIPSLINTNCTINNKLKTAKYISKLHLQYCAILSQQSKHQEALEHSKYAAKYLHFLLKNLNKDASRLLLETETSLLEGSANLILPIIQELVSRLIPEGNHKIETDKATNKINMKNLFGYSPPGDSIIEYNIGNIMQISPLTLIDLLSEYDTQFELTRESILDRKSVV